jgi:kynureninase
MTFSKHIDDAAELDRQDPLAGYREQFHIPVRDGIGEEIYLCGNSLGLQPKSTRDFINEELAEWEQLAVRGHFAAKRPWMPYHEFLTEKTSRLVGAKPDEVVNMNSLTVNLHLMMVSFYRPTKKRYKLLIESPAFPSDRYATESQVRFHGFDPADALLEIAPRPGKNTIRQEDLEELIEREGEQIALIMLPGVQYYSGQVFDMQRITQLGHAKGCVVGFDLAHATGNLVMHLHDWDVDFAVWCNYKYMNSGPGAVAGCFVHERHHKADVPRFAGWWGHDKETRFRMGPEFVPITTAEGWQLSNPPILALAPILASLEIFDEVGMTALRSKSERLTAYLEFQLQDRLADRIDIITPHNPAERGCQLSLRVVGGDADSGKRVFQALEDNGVVGDWREPDVIRVAPVPLYNRYMDVWRFVEILDKELGSRS